MSLRSLMMQTQQESYEDKISQKRRTLQDKFSVPLLFLNTSAIHLVQEHSSNFPEQKLLELEKLTLTEHFHVVSREVPGMSGRKERGLRCHPDNWDS